VTLFVISRDSVTAEDLVFSSFETKDRQKQRLEKLHELENLSSHLQKLKDELQNHGPRNVLLELEESFQFLRTVDEGALDLRKHSDTKAQSTVLNVIAEFEFELQWKP